VLGGAVGKVGSKVWGGKSNKPKELYHSTNFEAIPIIKESGFRTDLPDVKSAGQNNRFGRGVYLSDTVKGAKIERPGGTVVKIETNLGKNLDITDRGAIVDNKLAKDIARGAKKHGYDSITTKSVRPGGANNTVIFDPKNVKMKD
jgi:hypothetical protein